jgi:nitrate reductase assembly molybdenum cofactor insertion protein NarJ
MKEYISGWKNIIEKYDPDLLVNLDPFIHYIENTPMEFQQEYFVGTFDVQPLCCLDIGYILFGEDNRRGQFLANLKAEHRKAGNDYGTELPDNLTALLTLLPKLTDSLFAEELVVSLVIPAVNEIISGFRSDRNHYKALLRIIAAIMEKDYPCSQFERFQIPKRRIQHQHTTAEKTVPE